MGFYALAMADNRSLVTPLRNALFRARHLRDVHAIPVVLDERRNTETLKIRSHLDGGYSRKLTQEESDLYWRLESLDDGDIHSQKEAYYSGGTLVYQLAFAVLNGAADTGLRFAFSHQEIGYVDPTPIPKAVNLSQRTIFTPRDWRWWRSPKEAAIQLHLHGECWRKWNADDDAFVQARKQKVG